MNIQQYISSGIIEAYVLGMLSDEDRNDFESICKQYPEIAASKNDFELLLEKQLMDQSVQPPPELMENILNTISQQKMKSIPRKFQVAELAPVRRMNVWKWIAAASILLLAFSLYWANNTNNKYLNLRKENLALKESNRDPLNEVAYQGFKPVVERPSIKWSALVEPRNTAHCMAHIYWDSISKDTYLLLGHIPEPATDKQYQLWALINNDQVDLGVLDIKKEGMLIQMKNVYKAEAFAITIEKKGAHQNPHWMQHMQLVSYN